MSCKKYWDLIDDLVEGELSEAVAAQVNLHVFACRNCSRQFANLKKEKEIYAHFLFDAEPPADLWTRFQTTLEAGEIEENKVAFAASSVPMVKVARYWKGNLFTFPRLSAVPAGAAAMILIWFGILKFVSFEKNGNENYVAQTDLNKYRATAAAQLPETSGVKSNSFDVKPENRLAANSPEKHLKKDNKRVAFYGERKKAASILSVARVKTAKKIEREIYQTKERLSTSEAIRLTRDERLRAVYARKLEIEAARQIEKIELLLRSFRNAQAAASGGSTAKFDVAYEKQQARRLLFENVRLRRNAETYGTRDTEEILGKVEPYLLDISNLDRDAEPEKVLDIKERVKNQSIIASLQVY